MLPPRPEPTLSPPPPSASSQVRRPANEPAKGSILRTTGLLAGGAGLASLMIGAIFGVLAKVNADEAKKLCPASPCGVEGGVSSNTKALVDAKVANVMIGVGAGLLALGAVLYVVSPKQPSKAEAATVLGRRSPAMGRREPSPPRVSTFEPTVSAAGAGLVLGGTF